MMKVCSGSLVKNEGARKKGDKCGAAMYHCERCHKEGCWHKERDTCANQALANADPTSMKKICVGCGMSIYHPL